MEYGPPLWYQILRSSRSYLNNILQKAFKL